MMSEAKHSWQAFRSSAPGMRFQDRYRRRQRDSKGRWTAGSVAYIVGGLALAIAGLLLVPAPGPGWLITFFGVGLLCSELKPAARAMDRLEVWLRAWGTALKSEWEHTSGRAKVIGSLILAIVALLVGYGLWRLFFG